jgi:succinyl-CoA synthetase beta subunit
MDLLEYQGKQLFSKHGVAVPELYVERASEIDEEYYAAIVFDRSAKKPMAMLSRMGGMDVEEVAETDPEAMRMLHVDPLLGLQDLLVTKSREVVALDATVTVDDNALFRHPDVAEMRDLSAEEPQERMAKERGLTYVKLDGNVGILGNGAGLVMSTLDVVAQAGGKPANFLDAGGGSKAEAITSAAEKVVELAGAA